MPDTTARQLLKSLMEATYERVLAGIPESFEGLPRGEVKKYKRQLKIVRRRAVFDISLGVAVIAGNGYGVINMSLVAGAGLGTSAAAGVFLVRRGGHAVIQTSYGR